MTFFLPTGEPNFFRSVQPKRSYKIRPRELKNDIDCIGCLKYTLVSLQATETSGDLLPVSAVGCQSKETAKGNGRWDFTANTYTGTRRRMAKTTWFSAWQRLWLSSYCHSEVGEERRSDPRGDSSKFRFLPSQQTHSLVYIQSSVLCTIERTDHQAWPMYWLLVCWVEDGRGGICYKRFSVRRIVRSFNINVKL